MTLSLNNSSPLLLAGMMITLVLFVIIYLMMNLPQVQPGHAETRHGLIDATRARTCSDHPDMVFFNPELNRKAYVCILDGDIGAHFIDGEGNEITAYILSKVKSLSRAVEILAKTGFFPVQ